jgi:hypothetical protein
LATRTVATAADRPGRHTAGARPRAAGPGPAWPAAVGRPAWSWPSGRARACRARGAGRARAAGSLRARRCRGAWLRAPRRSAHSGGSRAERVVAGARAGPRSVPLTGARRRRRPWSWRCRPGGAGPWRRATGLRPRSRPGLRRRHLRAGTLVLRERHSDSRAGPLHGRRLWLCHWLCHWLCWLRRGRLWRGRLDLCGRLAVLGRRRGCLRLSARPAVRSPAGRGRLRLTGTVCCRSLGGLTCEFVFEPSDYRRLDRRGRGPDKLTHLLELGHHGLALDAELLSELVYPDLRHCAPSTRPGLTGPASRRGRACSVRRQFVLFIAACSSGAHRKFSLLSSRPARGCSPDRYSVTLLAGKGAGRRRARENALRRWARSKHARLGCRYAPRPGCRAVMSGTICSPAATRRIKSCLAARAPHPMQVRTGAARALSSLQGLCLGSAWRRSWPGIRARVRALTSLRRPWPGRGR